METGKRLIALGLRLAVFSAVFLLPLVFYLGDNEVFELPKSAALRVFGMMAFLMLLARREPVRARSIWGGLLFLGMAAISMVKTPLPMASLERIWELASILALLWAAEAAPVRGWALMFAASASYCLVTIYGMLQYFGIDWIQWTSFGEKRVYASMGNPDFLAAQTSFLIPIQVALLFAAWRRRNEVAWLLILCLALSLPSLFYTQARGAYLGFLAACVALAWLVHRYVMRFDLKRLFSAIAGLAGILVVLLFILPTGRHFIERVRELGDPLRSSSIQIRLFYWYSGWLMGRSAPLTGSGIGAFHLAGATAQGQAQRTWTALYTPPPEPPARNRLVAAAGNFWFLATRFFERGGLLGVLAWGADVVSPHLELYAHNDYVQLFAELGPTGLGLFLWIMVAVFAAGLSALSRTHPDDAWRRWLIIGLLASAVSYYVNSMMNFPLKVVSNAHFFYAIVLAALLPLTGLRLHSLPLPRHRVALSLVGLAFFLLAEQTLSQLVASSYLKAGHSILLMNATRYRESILLFGRASALHPIHTDAILIHFYRGKGYQAASDYPSAVESFGKAIAVFPDFPEGHQQKGLAGMAVASRLQETKKPAEADETLAAAIRELEISAWLNPKDPITWFYLGSAQRMRKRPAEAIEPFSQCLKLAGGRVPDAYMSLALSLIEARRSAEAVPVLQELLKINPNFPRARDMLSRLSAGRRR